MKISWQIGNLNSKSHLSRAPWSSRTSRVSWKTNRFSIGKGPCKVTFEFILTQNETMLELHDYNMLLTTYLEHRFLLYLTMMQWPQICTIFRAALPMTIVNLCFVSWGQSAARHQFVFQVVILYMVAGSIHTIQVIFHTSRVQVTVPSINSQTTQIPLDLTEHFFKKMIWTRRDF